MAYPPTAPTFTNINSNESFDLKEFNDRFSDLKTYAESLKEGIDTDKTDISNLSSSKVDKVTGKGLSTNDFVSANYYTKSDLYTKTEVNTELAKKVDKDGNKVLSDNNFTTLHKDNLEILAYMISDTSITRESLQSDTSSSQILTLNGTYTFTYNGVFFPIKVIYGGQDYYASASGISYNNKDAYGRNLTTTTFSNITISKNSSSFKFSYSFTFNHYQGSPRCVYAFIYGRVI